MLAHENVADTVQVLDHRHPGIPTDALDQATATTGHNDVDVFRHADQRTNGSAISGFHHLHHGGRQIGLGQAALDAGGDGTIGMNGFGAAAQDGRVARLQAQAGRIDGHIRP